MSQRQQSQPISLDNAELHRMARIHDLARLHAEQLRGEAIANGLGQCMAGAGRLLLQLLFWR